MVESLLCNVALETTAFLRAGAIVTFKPLFKVINDLAILDFKRDLGGKWPYSDVISLSR
jgi:hypothetical protein